MSNVYLRNITNHFQDVRLVSLSTWKKANEITPRDRSGPYVVLQEGYDPEDMKMIGEEFILGRSGKWLSLALFYRMPVPERRAEFVFGTAAEVMSVFNDLPSKAVIMRAGAVADAGPSPENDEIAAALRAGKDQPGTKG